MMFIIGFAVLLWVIYLIEKGIKKDERKRK